MRALGTGYFASRNSGMDNVRTQLQGATMRSFIQRAVRTTPPKL